MFHKQSILQITCLVLFLQVKATVCELPVATILTDRSHRGADRTGVNAWTSLTDSSASSKANLLYLLVCKIIIIITTTTKMKGL